MRVAGLWFQIGNSLLLYVVGAAMSLKILLLHLLKAKLHFQSTHNLLAPFIPVCVYWNQSSTTLLLNTAKYNRSRLIHIQYLRTFQHQHQYRGRNKEQNWTWSIVDVEERDQVGEDTIWQQSSQQQWRSITKYSQMQRTREVVSLRQCKWSI